MKIYEKQFYEIIIREMPKIRKSLDLLQKQNRAGIVKIIQEYQEEIHDLKYQITKKKYEQNNAKRN